MKFETSDYGQHWVDGHFATVATGYGALRFPATASLEEAKMTITQQAVRTEAAVRDAARKMAATLTYSTGFGNEHSSEALPGALPAGQNTPQHPPTVFTPSCCRARPSRNCAKTPAAPGYIASGRRRCIPTSNVSTTATY